MSARGSIGRDSVHQDDARIDTQSYDARSEVGSEILDDASSSCSDTSYISEASTLRYEQEPFAIFEPKVRKLIAELFPAYKSGNINTERMKGGSFNRITGISISTSSTISWKRRPWSRIRQLLTTWRRSGDNKTCDNKEHELILRVPRDDIGPNYMHRDVATLEYVSRKLKVAIPKVVCFDNGCDNRLGQPYMLQERLPGKPLNTLWEDLNISQKISATKLITELIFDIASVTNPFPGYISAENSQYDMMSGTVKLDRFRAGEDEDKPNTNSPPPTTLQHILEMCQHWDEDGDKKQDERCDHGMWDKFASVATKLHKLGFLPDDEKFHLCHSDLQTRNIMAEIVDETTVKITGVLDWDMAVFAPRFVAMQSPYTLWIGDEVDEYDEKEALSTPTEEELLSIKATYDSLAANDALCFAYKPEYVLLRRMFRLLQSGIYSNWTLTEAQDIVDDFNAYYPET